MKIVPDSNIIFAAFSSRGLCNSLFELCIEKHTIYFNTQIIDEISKNFKKKLKLPGENIQLIVAYLYEFCHFSEHEMINENISRDKDDDGIISLAFFNDAKYIITGDKDLLDLKKYKSIMILTPRQFWEISKNEKF